MGSISSVQSETLRALVRSAPDSALRSLDLALESDASGSPAMGEIRRMILAETADREVRDRVFRPLLALCRPAPGPLQRLAFPPATPAALWRVLAAEAPSMANQARRAEPNEDEPFPAVDDALCREAARRLRSRAGGYASIFRLTDGCGPRVADHLAACLELAPIVRRALHRLPDWTGRLTEDRAAAARIAYKDAVAVGDDCGPRLLEMLMAHLDEPWVILRVVSAVMDHPGDDFVAGSELASFGERVLDDIDSRLATVMEFDLGRGRTAGTEAGRAVHIATMEISAFEESIAFSRQGAWGTRLLAQKRQLASAVEKRLKHVEDAIAAALPLQVARRKGPRGHPRLSHDPDPAAIARAEALAAFVPEVRSAAAVAGFGAVRTQAADAVEARLAQYVEDLLEVIHLQAPEAARARLYLDAAAEMLGLISGSKAAQIVRRRAAAA